mgnify:CR=1 FL=1
MARENVDYRTLYEREAARRQALERVCKELTDERDRLGRLADELEKQLRAARIHLDKARSEIDEELEIAKSVQAGLLPRELPECINLKTADIYIPTGKVGGDMYDIIITPSQRIAVLIFDVSGHGVPSALIAAVAKMLFAPVSYTHLTLPTIYSV